MTDPDFVNSLARGLAVMGAFGRGNKKMTITQVAERTDLTRGTARRFLRTLCALGYMATDEKLYWLTPKVLNFSSNYLSTFGLGEAAYGYIQQLTEQLGETSSMSVLDDAEIVYVARVEKRRVFSNRIEVGTRLPAHTASMGLVLLSGLTDHELDAWLATAELQRFTPNTIVDKGELRRAIEGVRKAGYALSDGTLEEGVRSLSVPVHDREGRVIAALNVVTFASQMPLEEVPKRFLAPLRETARKLSGVLSSG
jgi:IclR family pca regulon transcriptional regulator